MQVSGISTALFGAPADPGRADVAPTNSSAQAHQEVAAANYAAAGSVVPPHATVTVYNAKGGTSQVGAVPSAPRHG